MNRGECRHLIEIWENQEAETTNRMGDIPEEPICVAKVWAKLEFRGGGLLTGRPADSVLTKTTQKFTYPYYDYPTLVADRNWIEYDGHKYNILYTLDEGNRHEWQQVFCDEQDYD